MNPRIHVAASRQSGVMLIEALVAILIFSIGILGIVGLQTSAVKASSDARYRSEAALLANELIGRMWASDRTSQATVQAAFSSAANGPAYQQWAWIGTVAGSPGTTTAPAVGTVLRTLPGASANLPTVAIVADSTTSVTSSQVTITISWQVPGEQTAAGVPIVHKYTTMALIDGS
jgi:type IV pilus assembly protein PilV